MKRAGPMRRPARTRGATIARYRGGEARVRSGSRRPRRWPRVSAATRSSSRTSGRVRRSSSMVDRSRARPNSPSTRSRPEHHREQDPLGVVDPAEVGEELAPAPSSVARARPTASRCAGLLEEAGQPRQEEEAAGGDGGGDPEPWPSGPRPVARHQATTRTRPGGAEQPEGPVVGVEEGGGDEGHRRPGGATTAVPGPAARREPAGEGQEHDQGVHAGLVGVPDRERQGPEHEDGEPAQGASPARRRRRSRPAGRVATAKTPDSARTATSPVPKTSVQSVEEHVVERGVAVVAEPRRCPQGQRGDVDAQRLVEPQRRRGDEPEHRSGDGTTTTARATSHVGGEGADGLPSGPPRRSLAPVRSSTDMGRDCTGVAPSTVAAPGRTAGPVTTPNQVPESADDPAPLA